MAIAHHKDENVLHSSEHELLSLYARYPEITFDAEIETMARTFPDQTHSSPLSTTEKDEGETSRLSDSTAHTTPLRGQLIRMNRPPEVDTLPGFRCLVRGSDLDEECSQVFVGLGYAVIILAQAIFSSNRSISSQSYVDDILRLCQSLLLPVLEASGRIENHIQNISRLKSLVTFNTQPTDGCLWSSYRQRAQLIIRHAALPSISESKLTSALAQLFNRQIYTPFLNTFDDDEGSDNKLIARALNQLYDAMMTWQENYTRWCSHMKDLKYQYMLPLLERIHASPKVLQEIQDLRMAKAVANELLARPGAPGTMPVDESVIQALRLSAQRRYVCGKRVKSKITRGHTV